MLCGHAVADNYLGLCGQKSSYKHASNFEQLRIHDVFKLRMRG